AVTGLARGDCVEIQRFGLARRMVDIRPHSVARASHTLQKIVALREPKIDQLAIVARRNPTQHLERRPCLDVTLRSKQPLGAPDLELVSCRSCAERLTV